MLRRFAQPQAHQYRPRILRSGLRLAKALPQLRLPRGFGAGV